MKGNKDCFIIIGGSKSHLPFIEAAKKIGLKTVVFDINDDCVGRQKSDLFYQISIHDTDQIISKCSDIKSFNNIKGIMTYSNNIRALHAVAKISKKMGLPSYSSNSINLASNKVLMKDCFINSGIPTPKAFAARNLEEAIEFFNNLDGSVIMKPSGSQGSEGVVLATKESDIIDGFDISFKSSLDSNIILEEYHEGREFSIDGIVDGSNIVVLSVSEKFNLGSRSNFIIAGFSMGKINQCDEILLSNIDLIKETAKSAVNAMNIKNSFFSVDLLLTINGPIVLEAGVLLDCKIDRLLSFSGVDVYQTYINLICGETPQIKEPVYEEGFAMAFKFSFKDGLLSNLDDSHCPSNTKIEWEIDNGDPVYQPRSISDIVCWVIKEGDNSGSAYQAAMDAAKNIKLDIS
jgi:carbamoyl-phosphate synthase large subunit